MKDERTPFPCDNSAIMTGNLISHQSSTNIEEQSVVTQLSARLKTEFMTPKDLIALLYCLPCDANIGSIEYKTADSEQSTATVKIVTEIAQGDMNPDTVLPR